MATAITMGIGIYAVLWIINKAISIQDEAMAEQAKSRRKYRKNGYYWW
jgi:hypothetical protein